MRTTGKPIEVAYAELLESRKDNPCTPGQQAGQFWDEEKQVDKRFLTPQSGEKTESK